MCWIFLVLPGKPFETNILTNDFNIYLKLQHVFGKTFQLDEVWKRDPKNVPTATMPDSTLPDISLQILFSMSLPHICWYSWKTNEENNHN